jgi:hypothetical protein
MEKNDIIGFCLKYELTKDEFFAYEIICRKNSEACDNWIKINGEINKEILLSLYNKGLIIVSSISNPSYLSSIISGKAKSEQLDDLESISHELWNSYPAALPLGDGGMFIARKGPDKQEVLKLYLERINFNPEKHKFVLEQLKKYVKLVHDRKINGHRIHDWISNEMWDIIPELEAASRGEFKTDI